MGDVPFPAPTVNTTAKSNSLGLADSSVYVICAGGQNVDPYGVSVGPDRQSRLQRADIENPSLTAQSFSDIQEISRINS